MGDRNGKKSSFNSAAGVLFFILFHSSLFILFSFFLIILSLLFTFRSFFIYVQYCPFVVPLPFCLCILQLVFALTFWSLLFRGMAVRGVFAWGLIVREFPCASSSLSVYCIHYLIKIIGLNPGTWCSPLVNFQTHTNLAN